LKKNSGKKIHYPSSTIAVETLSIPPEPRMKRWFSFGLLVCLVTVCSAANAQTVDKIVAKVDNEIVLKSEVELGYIQYLSNGQTDKGDLKCQILESLLVNKLMVAKAEIDSVVVDKSMVDDELSGRMKYFISQIGSEKKLEEYYGKTIDQLKQELRKQVKEQLITQKMQKIITGSVKITPSDVKRYFSSIPKDSLPYFSTEVEIGQIVKLPTIGKEQKLAAKEQLEKIKARILNGEDFCALAKEYSEDPGSAPNCGELGFFSKGSLVPEYEAAAYKLKSGEMSLITESEYGYHLIQMIERRPNEINTRHILIKPKSSGGDLLNSQRFLDSLRTAILNDSISFSKAAKEVSDDKNTKDNGGLFMDENSATSKIAMENLDPGIFFIIDTMKTGTISTPVPYRMEDGTEAVRILYYKSKTPPHQANLVDDYQKIYNAAMNEKKTRIMSEWFDKTKGEVFIDVDKDYNMCKLLISQ
jgi:peptidyl-prolyl cis-trans isomerase SurA